MSQISNDQRIQHETIKIPQHVFSVGTQSTIFISFLTSFQRTNKSWQFSHNRNEKRDNIGLDVNHIMRKDILILFSHRRGLNSSLCSISNLFLNSRFVPIRSYPTRKVFLIRVTYVVKLDHMLRKLLIHIITEGKARTFVNLIFVHIIILSSTIFCFQISDLHRWCYCWWQNQQHQAPLRSWLFRHPIILDMGHIHERYDIHLPHDNASYYNLQLSWSRTPVDSIQHLHLHHLIHHYA